VKSKRPVNLALHTLTFPPMAIASILHRISGIVLFLLFPCMLYFWQMSLQSPERFSELRVMFDCPWLRLLVWSFGSALIYHAIAGIRHLLSDLDVGDRLPLARWTAYGAIGLSVMLMLCLGMLLC
jgi:succinate dehydrogenase / fumarate reductase cytochrome b subunit